MLLDPLVTFAIGLVAGLASAAVIVAGVRRQELDRFAAEAEAGLRAARSARRVRRGAGHRLAWAGGRR